VGLPLTIIFLLEYSLIPEVASDEEGVMDQRIWGRKGQSLEQA